jgi:hypothetical protein
MSKKTFENTFKLISKKSAQLISANKGLSWSKDSLLDTSLWMMYERNREEKEDIVYTHIMTYNVKTRELYTDLDKVYIECLCRP